MSSPADDGSPSDRPELQLDLPARPEYVRTARHTVAALARLHDTDDDVVENVRLAVSEAVTSAIRAEEDSGARIAVSARIDGDRIRIGVEGPSGGLAAAVEGDPNEIDTADLPFESALAVPIIRGLAEEVSVIPTEEGGTRLLIALSLRGPASGTSEDGDRA